MQKLKSEMKAQVEIEEILHLIAVNFNPRMGYKALCGLTPLSVRQLIELFKKSNTQTMNCHGRKFVLTVGKLHHPLRL